MTETGRGGEARLTRHSGGVLNDVAFVEPLTPQARHAIASDPAPSSGNTASDLAAVHDLAVADDIDTEDIDATVPVRRPPVDDSPVLAWAVAPTGETGILIVAGPVPAYAPDRALASFAPRRRRHALRLALLSAAVVAVLLVAYLLLAAMRAGR